MLLRRGHLPAKCWRPIVLNVISSNVLLPQHWSMLSQHNPTGGSASAARSYYSNGPTGSSELHSSDWDDRPLNSRTSFRGHLILDRKTKTYNAFHFNGNAWAVCQSGDFCLLFLMFYCVYSISSNLYGPLLILGMVQETICPLNTFCSWNLNLCFSYQL